MTIRVLDPRQPPDGDAAALAPALADLRGAVVGSLLPPGDLPYHYQTQGQLSSDTYWCGYGATIKNPTGDDTKKISALAFRLAGMYRGIWRYASIEDLGLPSSPARVCCSLLR